MLHAALLAVTFSALTPGAAVAAETPIHRCLGSMDGAVYQGDPTDRTLMKANVAACERGFTQIERIKPGAARGPEKLFLLGRILDRAATLSFMGLGDARTALHEVEEADLYFRIASGLPNQSKEYRTAAVANAELTGIQLRTLRAETAPVAALRAKRERHIAKI